MPVRTFVYKKTEDGGSYNLVQSETKLSWVSPGVHYRGTYNDGYKVDAIIAATGTHTASKPYTTKQYKKGERIKRPARKKRFLRKIQAVEAYAVAS